MMIYIRKFFFLSSSSKIVLLIALRFIHGFKISELNKIEIMNENGAVFSYDYCFTM